MDDRDIIRRIGGLVDEEHRLRGQSGPVSAETNERIGEIEGTLDQCWDLLRQRRARRSAGGDPAEAVVRSAHVVEHYRQ